MPTQVRGAWHPDVAKYSVVSTDRARSELGAVGWPEYQIKKDTLGDFANRAGLSSSFCWFSFNSEDVPSRVPMRGPILPGPEGARSHHGVQADGGVVVGSGRLRFLSNQTRSARFRLKPRLAWLLGANRVPATSDEVTIRRLLSWPNLRRVVEAAAATSWRCA